MFPATVVTVAWDGIKIAFVSIKRRLEYVMRSKRYADCLGEEVRNLEYQADRVRRGAERATRNLEDTEKWVDKFLESAEKALKEAGDLSGEFENMSKTCCRGTLPDPICRYRFSREAKHTTDYIKNLIQEIGGKEISAGRPASGDVAARREGKGVVQLTTATASTSSASTSIKLRDDGVFESRASVMQKIMDALADNTKSMVGVHGMGGVGKSTLLVDVERILRKEKSFHWVAKADVSQNPDIKTIQKEIAHCLGLSIIKEEEDVKLRAKLLLERLEDEERNKRKVLIMLDDLWEQLDLRQVGIPCGHNNRVKGCKLLMTARHQYVLEREMLCDVAFHLGFLKDEEAKGLFEATVGGKVRAELEPLVEKALGICGGLPFLILVIAKLFINTTYSECKHDLNEIWNGEAGEKIDRTLRVSYNRLKTEEQSLLGLCAVYGVPRPSLENLVRYGVGLGLFGRDRSMGHTRVMLGRLIRNLQASSLLLHSEEDDGFKIHDLVRMFVASIVSRDHPLLMLKDESVAELWRDKVKSCGALCIPYFHLKELPEQLDCPDLKIFMLFTYNNPLRVPDSYFNSMRNLMVLDLKWIRLSRLPSPFQSLEKLHTLCLSCCSLENVAILGELKELQILSIQSFNLHRLPQEIGQLTELRLLDLNGCSELQMIEPGVLGSLTKLEEFYMENSFVGWSAMDQTPPTNASLIELNNMKNLCTLYVSIPNPSVLPQDLNFKQLTKYRINIGKLRRWPWGKGSSTLDLRLDPKGDVLWKRCIQSILGKIDEMFLEDLNGSEQNICKLSQKGFPELKHLEVLNSPSVHYILQSRSRADFEKLESLLLKSLLRLEKICHGLISSKSFCALKVVTVQSCDKMEVLFPLSVVRRLPQLEEIAVDDCKSMCGIVEVDDRGKLELPKLRVLKLQNLPNITSFFTDGTASLSGTSDDQVGTPIAFLNGQQVAFPRLETLEIIGLDNLRFIFSPSVFESLSQLRDLTVSKCNKMEAIIMEEEGLGLEIAETLASPIESEVAFHQLKYIKFDGLKELRCFSSGGYNLMFPLLEDITVGECPNMSFFSKGLTNAPNLERVQAIPKEFSESTKQQNFWEGDVNIAIQNMCEEMGTFAAVKDMWLSEIPKLIGKWQSELNPIKSYWQLNSLTVDKCPSFVNAIPPKLMLALDNLSILRVLNCELLEEIYDLEGLEVMKNTRVLPQLATLTLGYLPKLRQLWNKDLQGMLRFKSLTRLTLYKCSNLRHVFSPSMVRCVANLRWMEIKKCDQMEKVITEEEGQGSAVEKITFAKLHWIMLEYLPNLTSFLSGKNQMLKCPQFKILSIAYCPKMRSLTSGPSLFSPQVQFPRLQWMYLSCMDNLSKIWTDNRQETFTFDNLKRVEAQNCKSLENLFPYWVATSLNRLQGLRLESCGIKEIIAGDGTPHSNVAQVLFPKLTWLVLHDNPQLKSFCPDLPTLSWPLLEQLQVTHCDKLNNLSFAASIDNWAAHSSFERGFPNLERVILVEKEIQMIHEGKFPIDIFGKPKVVTLACFHGEKPVFPPRSFLERFPNLQRLEVFCSSFEDIFLDKELVDKGKHLVLEGLRELKLIKLPNLKRVWREDYLVSKIFQSIKLFKVYDCPSLTTLFPTTASFRNLTKLEVANSSGLVHLVTVSAVTNLVHLTWMTIIGCERMKEVVENDENGEGKVISFGKLKWLTLQQLPSLECFSSTISCSFRFPSLLDIIVEECPKMKIFSKSTLSTPKLANMELFGLHFDWNWKGDLNAAIQKLAA